jgi:hypothetical protein
MITPQWPWLVYSQKHTSAMTQSPGTFSLIACVALWTMPSLFQACEPSGSFLSGMPKRITEGTPASQARFASVTV